MRNAWRALLASTAVLAPVSAQEPPVVDPAPFEWVATERATGFPFGYPDRAVVRYQEVHDGLRGRAMTIRGIALRRHAASTGAAPAFRATVAMRLSTAITTAATIDRAFARNEGADAVAALPTTTIAFPATAGPYGGTAPFAFSILATRPFTFAGRGPLCVELRVAAHTNRVPMTFALHEDGKPGTGTTGKACHGTGLTVSLGAGAEAIHKATGLPAGAPAVLLLGVSFDKMGALALPFDLAPLGAPGCAVRVAPLDQITGFAQADGSFQAAFSVNRAPPGGFYGAQAVGIKPGVNRLGAVFTNAAVMVPRAGRSAGRVWAEDLSATTGRAQPVFGLVLSVLR